MHLVLSGAAPYTVTTLSALGRWNKHLAICYLWLHSNENKISAWNHPVILIQVYKIPIFLSNIFVFTEILQSHSMFHNEGGPPAQNKHQLH